MHTRFEHSLGVMHTATLLYDAIRQKSAEILKAELDYNDDGLARDKQLVRLAALLHDVGHGPFSHSGEELFPWGENGSRYKHEHYSAAIVRRHLSEVIEKNPWNQANYHLRADEIAELLEGSTKAKQSLFWRDLIVGQMDADRMDYLLRDSHHLGVQYGSYDLDRVINTIQAIPGVDGRAPRFGISEGGWHAAEALVLARYFMFTQVYFHKTRVAYDIHFRGVLKDLLPGGCFPRPVGEELDEFLKWDDWRVLGSLSEGGGGEHGERLKKRDHYREVHHTAEVRSPDDERKLERIKGALGNLLAEEYSARSSWYKTGPPDIPVILEKGGRSVDTLSSISKVIENLKGNDQVRLYVKPEHQKEAEEIVARTEGAS